MLSIGQILVGMLRDAWGAIAMALLGIGALAMLAQVIRTSGALVLRANLWVWESLAAILGILFLLLFGFLGVPALSQAAQSSLPGVAVDREVQAYLAASAANLAEGTPFEITPAQQQAWLERLQQDEDFNALFSRLNGSCQSPMVELGIFSSLLVGAIGALRMLVSVFQSVLAGLVGGGGLLSRTLSESAEALLGMLIAGVAAPIISALLGGC